MIEENDLHHLDGRMIFLNPDIDARLIQWSLERKTKKYRVTGKLVAIIRCTFLGALLV